MSLSGIARPPFPCQTTPPSNNYYKTNPNRMHQKSRATRARLFSTLTRKKHGRDTDSNRRRSDNRCRRSDNRCRRSDNRCRAYVAPRRHADNLAVAMQSRRAYTFVDGGHMANRVKWTNERIALFLDVLPECGGNISEALRLVNVSHSSYYDKRDTDPDFAAAADVAIDRGIDMLESEARRRAYRGVERVEISQGKPVYMRDPKGRLVLDDENQPILLKRVEYSDQLMGLLLRAHRPKFRTERHEHTGADGTPLNAEVVVYLPDNGRVPKGAGGGSGTSGRKRRRTARRS